MSYDIDALFEDNFLTASIISSLDIGLKEKHSPPKYSLINLQLSSFSKD